MKRRVSYVCASCFGLTLICLVGLIAIVQIRARILAQNVVTETDIVYGMGGSEPLKLDLEQPRNGKGPFPAIVLVHGGGWVGG